MYKCRDCKAVFWDEDTVWNYEADTGYRWFNCPVCGSENIGEAGGCLLCDGDFTEDELKDGICEDCRKNFTIDFAEFRDYLFEKGLFADFICTKMLDTNLPGTKAFKDGLLFIEGCVYDIMFRDMIDNRVLPAEREAFMAVCREYALEDVEDYIEYINSKKKERMMN